jgi:hypothetical protein
MRICINRSRAHTVSSVVEGVSEMLRIVCKVTPSGMRDPIVVVATGLTNSVVRKVIGVYPEGRKQTRVSEVNLGVACGLPRA